MKEYSVYVPMDAIKLARYVFTVYMSGDPVDIPFAMEYEDGSIAHESESDFASEFYSIQIMDIKDCEYILITRYGGGDEPFIQSICHSENTFCAIREAISTWIYRNTDDDNRIVHVEIAHHERRD